jgi:hypothetical protein
LNELPFKKNMTTDTVERDSTTEAEQVNNPQEYHPESDSATEVSSKPATSRQETQDKWIDRFNRHVESGLSAKEFCENEGVTLSSFYSERKKRNLSGASSDAVTPQKSTRKTKSVSKSTVTSTSESISAPKTTLTERANPKTIYDLKVQPLKSNSELHIDLGDYILCIVRK